jgi:hypothetical protein
MGLQDREGGFDRPRVARWRSLRVRHVRDAPCEIEGLGWAGSGRREARGSFEGDLEIQGHSKCAVNN